MSVDFGDRRSDLEAVVDKFRKEPRTTLKCIHDICGDSAVCVFFVPQGCVALPGVEVQPLCLQHIETDGSLAWLYPYFDLTINARLSIDRGYEPEFCIIQEGNDRNIRVIPFAHLVQH